MNTATAGRSLDSEESITPLSAPLLSSAIYAHLLFNISPQSAPLHHRRIPYPPFHTPPRRTGIQHCTSHPPASRSSTRLKRIQYTLVSSALSSHLIPSHPVGIHHISITLRRQCTRAIPRTSLEQQSTTSSPDARRRSTQPTLRHAVTVSISQDAPASSASRVPRGPQFNT
ncbi:hypothetical protein F503_03975 [Ophiostoma piceae UAMH 11346]|uniref:Uncharacterized protein n=1 Tax=Ophiostoma piceae (strain UAMH 11346) TaxID=1262450 RepID=S3CP71_OPHP1|nr:hypothetical protein F503_03975 [Ophiostoma piceae UAMH 11346]